MQFLTRLLQEIDPTSSIQEMVEQCKQILCSFSMDCYINLDFALICNLQLIKITQWVV